MRHAPSGGVWIEGDWYAGGQFLPDDEPSLRRRSARSADEFDDVRAGAVVRLRLADALPDTCRVLFVDRAGRLARCLCTDQRGIERQSWIDCRVIQAELKETGDARAA
jgi:hypothetical protein